MTGLAFLLFAAAIAFGISRLTRLPAIPLLLLAGFAMKSLAEYAGVEIPADALRNIIELGLAVLVFAAGIDLSPNRIRGRYRSVLFIGIAQFFAIGVIGVGATIALGYSWTVALYLGCALSASSTLVVVRQLQQRQRMFEPYGRLVLGVLLLQDVLIVVLLVVLINAPDGAIAVTVGLWWMAALAVLAGVLHHYVMPFIARSMHLDDEENLLVALGTLFSFISLATLVDLPFIVGGFLAGFALSAFPMNGLIRGMVGSLTSFFLALFFIGIGVLCSVPSFNYIIHALLLAVVLVVGTVVLVTVLAERSGLSTRGAIESGILLSQTSEFSLLIMLAGVTAGQISLEVFSMFALLTVGTMTLTPFISRESVVWKLMRLHPRASRRSKETIDLHDHAIILGYGQTGPKMLEVFRNASIPTLVIDDDAAVIEALQAEDITCLEGDGSSREVLARANIGEARVILATVRRLRDLADMLEATRDTRTTVIVRTHSPEQRDLVEAAGGVAIDTTVAAVEAMERWINTNL